MSSTSPNPVQNGLQSMEDIEWADLIELDLSIFDDGIGKQRLANRLAKAVRTNGFFTVKNFGIPKEEIEQQFKLCEGFFGLSLEEKLPYYHKDAHAAGDQTGYRPIGAQMRKINFLGRRKDNIEIYNIPRQDGYHKPAQPKILQDHMKEIETFQKEVLKNVVQKLLQLIGIILHLPDENQLAKVNDFSKKGEDVVRYLKYGGLPAEGIEADGGIYGAQHADISLFTMNFRQPVAALQILDSDEEWKWIKPWEDTIMVNVGDILKALTGGYVKSGVHRVHAPPREQIHLDRFSVLFVCRGDSDFIMDSIKNSPVLQRAEKEIIVGVDQGLPVDQWIKVWVTHLKAQDDLERAEAANVA